MIEARELRIGNYLKPIKDSQDDFIEVVEVYVESFYCEDSAGIIFISTNNEIEPIPLTEEWLLNFGFNVDDSLLDPPNTPNGNFWIDYIKDNVVISMPFFEFNYNETEANIEIKYVHQLQNLYFALTNEELTIKTEETKS